MSDLLDPVEAGADDLVAEPEHYTWRRDAGWEIEMEILDEMKRPEIRFPLGAL